MKLKLTLFGEEISPYTARVLRAEYRFLRRCLAYDRPTAVDAVTVAARVTAMSLSAQRYGYDGEPS